MTSLKLLVVEDDAASLELMTEVFTSLKAEVRPVSDSEKAAGMVNQEKFDGIFLDLEMPKLSGFDLARVIRESSWNKSTPIIKDDIPLRAHPHRLCPATPLTPGGLIRRHFLLPLLAQNTVKLLNKGARINRLR